MIGLAVLACLPLAPCQDASAEVAAALAQGRFGAAMAAAHELPEGAVRDGVEADVLYQAGSYDAALERALSAIEAGDFSALTLSRGIAAASWIGDTQTGRELLASLEQTIGGLAPGDQPGWRQHALDLVSYLEGSEDRAREAAASQTRAKWTASLLGLCSLALLGLGLRRTPPGDAT